MGGSPTDATSRRYPTGLAHIPALLLAKRVAVSGRSMEPTLLAGERVLVNRLAFRRHPPARGDVVLARDPREPTRLLIKRVAAVPGDAVRQDAGRLTVNDAVVLDWSDVRDDVLLPEAAWRLAADEFFLLGDAADLHPASSTDSRAWGPVARRLIVGRVWAVYWPPSRARRVE